MKQVQNGHLYIKERSSSMKNRAEEYKKAYKIHALANLVLKPDTLYVWITFLKVEKQKPENFTFC